MRIVYSVELHRRKEFNGILKGDSDVHLVGPGLDTASAVAWRIAKDRAAGIAQGEWDTRFFIADEDGDRRIHVSRMFLTVTPGSRPIGVEVAFDADADAIAASAGHTADLLGPDQIINALETGAPAEAMQSAFGAWAQMRQSVGEESDRDWFDAAMTRTQASLDRLRETERRLLGARGETILQKLLLVTGAALELAGAVQGEAQNEARAQKAKDSEDRIRENLTSHQEALASIGREIADLRREVEQRTSINAVFIHNSFLAPLSNAVDSMRNDSEEIGRSIEGPVILLPPRH
jgi:hypothetical protein